MNNESKKVIDTSTLPDATWGRFLPQKVCKSPLVTVVSKTAQLRERFLDAAGPASYMNDDDFPEFLKDPRIVKRALKLLNEDYIVEGKSVNQWIKTFEEKIGEENVLKIIHPGSSSHYTTGIPLLKCCLNKFYNKISLQDYAKMSGKIMNKEFNYSDVDIKIQVNQSKILSDLYENVLKDKTSIVLFSNQNILIVRIGKENEPQIDFTFYTIEGVGFAFYGDDFGIDLKNSDFNNDIIAITSKNRLKWWQSKVLEIAENEGGRKDFRLFLRLLGKESKGEVCIDSLESELFKEWIKKIKDIKEQLDKQWKDHDSKAPIARYLISLRAQQVIFKQLPNDKELIKQAAKIDDAKDIPPFIIQLFEAMKEKGADIRALHGLLECIALNHLCEGDGKGFQVKLVKHGWNEDKPEWVIRMRFRGNFGKRDLLLKFKPQESLDAIKNINRDQLRRITHSLYIDGSNLREITTDYKRSLSSNGLDPKTQAAIREALFGTNRYVVFTEPSSLAELEMSACKDPKAMLNLGRFIFDFYDYDPNLRDYLCWKVIDTCIGEKWYFHGAEMIRMMRRAELHPEDGYPAFFIRALTNGCDDNLLKACCPFNLEDEEKWVKLLKNPTRKTLAGIVAELHISSELFLEMIRISDMEKQSMSEGMLCGIIQDNPAEAYAWIEKMDKFEFITDAYKKLLSSVIIQNRGVFSCNWLLKFLKTERFEGKMDEKISLCSYMISTQIPVLEKAELLEKLKIDDSSLWRNIANECVSHGEVLPKSIENRQDIGAKEIISCFKIIERADEQAIEDLRAINGLLDKQLRGAILIRILRNWKIKKASPEVLEFFDISEKDWKWADFAFKANDAGSILKELKDRKGAFALYSSLFRVLQPKEPYFSKWWVNMCLAFTEKFSLEKFLTLLEQPKIRDCLRIAEQELLPIINKIKKSERGLNLIIDVLDKPSQELLYILMDEAIKFNDDAKIASRLFLKYHDNAKSKKNNAYKANLIQLAQKHLSLIDGNYEIAASIWKFAGNIPFLTKLPATQNLIKLINADCADWVISMLKESKEDQLNSIEPKLYNVLLQKVKNPESRRSILLLCRVDSESICNVWEQTILDKDLPASDLMSLVSCSSILKLSDATVSRCAMHVLSKYNKADPQLAEDVVKILIDIVSRMELSIAYDLWEMLRKSNKVSSKMLWQAGCSLIEKDPTSPKHTFIEWIINKASKNPSDNFLLLLEKVTMGMIDEVAKPMISTYVKPFALKQNATAQKIYWKLDIDNDVAVEELELLGATPESYQNLLFRLVQIVKGKKPDQKLIRSIYKAWMSYKETAYNETYMADVLDQLIKNHESLLTSEKHEILLFNNEKKLFRSDIECLINPLLLSGGPVQYANAILSYLEFSSNTKLITPLVLILISYSPVFADRIETLIKKVEDEARRGYLYAIFYYTKLQKNGTHEGMLQFLDNFNTCFSYLKVHQKEENYVWINLFKWDNSVEFDETMQYFYNFLVGNLMPNDAFFNVEIINKFLDIVDKQKNENKLLLLVLERLVVAISKSKNMEIANEVIKFIVNRTSMDSIHPTAIDSYCMLNFSIANLIIEDLSLQASWGTVFAEKIHALIDNYEEKDNNLSSKSEEDDFFHKLYGICIALSEKFSQSNIEPDVESKAICFALKALFRSPHPKSVHIAEKLLAEGIKRCLCYNTVRLMDANYIYVSSILERPLIKENISNLIPSLFRHLSKDMFVHNLKLYSAVKEIIFDIIELNILKICKTGKDLFPALLKFLNRDIHKIAPNFFLERPNVLKDYIPTFAKNWSECEDLEQKDEILEELSFLMAIHCNMDSAHSEDLIFMKSQKTKSVKIVDWLLDSLNYQKKINRINHHEGLIKIKPKTDPNSTNLLDLTIEYRWCQKVINFCSISHDKKVIVELLDHLTDNFITCLCLSPPLSSGCSLTLPLIHTLKIIVELIGFLAKTDAANANRWITQFIEKFMKSTQGGKIAEFYPDIILQFCEGITPHLLPSLPDIEKLHNLYSKNLCIDAYYKLISCGCKDDAIIDKAITNHFLLQFEFNSKKKLPIQNFQAKFEVVYLAGFKRLISNRLSSQNRNKVDNEFVNFTMRVDAGIRILDGFSGLIIEQIMMSLYEVKDLMKDLVFRSQTMEFLHLLFTTTIKPIDVKDKNALSRAQINFLIFSLLCSDSPAISFNLIQENNIKDLVLEDEAERVEYYCKRIFLFCEPKFLLERHSKLTYDRDFRKVFIASMNKLIGEFNIFKQIVPDISKRLNNSINMILQLIAEAKKSE